MKSDLWIYQILSSLQWERERLTKRGDSPKEHGYVIANSKEEAIRYVKRKFRRQLRHEYQDELVLVRKVNSNIRGVLSAFPMFKYKEFIPRDKITLP